MIAQFLSKLPDTLSPDTLINNIQVEVVYILLDTLIVNIQVIYILPDNFVNNIQVVHILPNTLINNKQVVSVYIVAHCIHCSTLYTL